MKNMGNNKPGLVMDEEMSLDDWVNKTLAPTTNTIYFIISSISRFMDSLNLDRRMET